jgi:hypothetical protein
MTVGEGDTRMKVKCGTWYGPGVVMVHKKTTSTEVTDRKTGARTAKLENNSIESSESGCRVSETEDEAQARQAKDASREE